MSHYHRDVSRSKSDLSKINTVPVFVTLLVAASYCTERVLAEKKVRRHCENTSKGPCQNE